MSISRLRAYREIKISWFHYHAHCQHDLYDPLYGAPGMRYSAIAIC
jgi:hypothetical protein